MSHDNFDYAESQEHGATDVGTPAPMETASATTSPDNASSGSTAYAIVGAALGALLILAALIGLALSSALNVWAGGIAQMMDDQGQGTTIPYGYGDGSDDGYGITIPYDYGDGYGTAPYGYDDGSGSNGNGDSGSTQDSLTVDEALDLTLSAYDAGITEFVPATAYSGASSEVTSVCTALVKTDKDYSSRLSAAVLNAARDADDRPEQLAEAHAVCTEAREALGGLDLGASDQTETLSSARDEAIARWDDLDSEVSLLESGGDIPYDELYQVDMSSYDHATQSASLIAEALSASAQK